jgi:hypothetical protein
MLDPIKELAWVNAVTALHATKANLENGTATQADVDAAVAAMQTALQYLLHG